MTEEIDPSSMTGDEVQTTLPRKRELILNQPGVINVAGERGHYNGCRLVKFHKFGAEGLEDDDRLKFEAQLSGNHAEGAAAMANLYFKHRGNLLCVESFVDINGNYWCFITNTLNEEQMEVFQIRASVMQEEVERRVKEREEKLAKDEELAVKAEKELERLAGVGKRAEDNKLFDEVRELREELKKANAELNRINKANKKKEKS